MRILFLSHRIPYPPDKGEKIRAFHQLRALSARHEVDVFTLADDPRDLVHREALVRYCHELSVARVYPKLARARSLPYLLTSTPLTIPYFSSRALRSAVHQALSARKYDRIFVYCSAMAQYVPWERRSADDGVRNAAGHTPVIIDLVDVDSNKWAQYAEATSFPFSTVYRNEARHLRRYERTMSERSDCVIVSTEREASLIRAIAPQARVHVVPVGVSLPVHPAGGRDLPDGPPTIVFTGDMGYFPNQEGVVFFARQVLPLIRRGVPHARFLIVGRNPGRNVLELGALDHVDVTGAVPDVQPWLAQASVSVVPLMIASGIQTKILEAMAFGLPVVATPRAVQGLTADVAACVDTAESAETIASHVTRLLLDPQQARARGLEGRRRVGKDYSWETALDHLLRVVEDPGGAAEEPKPAEALASA